jgi:Trp operon repressor
MKVLTIRITDKQYNDILLVSKEEEISMVQIVRDAINKHLFQRKLKKKFDNGKTDDTI